MKKGKVIVSIILMVSLLGLTACGKSEAKDPIFRQMEEANNAEALMKNNEKIGFQFSYYFSDGNVDSSYIYKDQELYVWETPYGILIDDKGEVYGFDNMTNTPLKYVFVDTYEDFKVSDELLIEYRYTGGETVISSEEKDGVIYLKTKDDNVEPFAEDMEYYGYDAANIESILSEYEIDAETYEVLNTASKLKTKDGSEQLFFDMVRVIDCEKYQPEEQLVNSIFSDDMRTVTLIANAGTEEEKQYTQTVTKGSQFVVYISPEYENKMYLDPECTQESEDTGDYSKDVTYYLKNAK